MEDKRKQRNKDNKLLKIFNRHKDKHYKQFKKIAEQFLWSEIPDLCGLIIISKFVTGTAKPILQSVDENGVYIYLEQQDIDRFLDKSDETVTEVVQALLQCGVSARNGKLFIQTK